MKTLGAKELNSIFFKVLLSDPIRYHFVFSLKSFHLNRIFRGGDYFLIRFHQNPTKKGSPFTDFVFSLLKDNLERVLINRVLAHGDEHFESPRKLLSISEVIGSILFKVLVKSIKNSFKVKNFIIVAISLTRHIFIHEVFKKTLIYHSKTFFRD